jgi:hypothetical protein
LLQKFHSFAPQKKKKCKNVLKKKIWFCDVAKVATMDAKIQLNLAINKI